MSTTRSGARARRPAARPRRAQARRTKPPLRRRARRRLPRMSRLVAGVLATMLIAGLVVLLTGPWLRVTQVSWSGERFTPPSELAERLEAVRGENLLLLESEQLAERIQALPAVAGVQVSLRIPDAVQVHITEKEPAFVWQTSASRLVVGADGIIIARLPPDAGLDEALAELPIFDDARSASQSLEVGDAIPTETIALGLQLRTIDPALLGSDAKALSLRIEDEYGFVLVSTEPPWRAAFGFYGLDPSEPASVAERIEQQAAAVRTLFATEPESSVSWVDARNPMKVYFRATDG